VTPNNAPYSHENTCVTFDTITSISTSHKFTSYYQPFNTIGPIVLQLSIGQAVCVKSRLDLEMLTTL